MAGGRLQAPRGTFDVLPEDARRRMRLAGIADELFERAGYGYFESPVFEYTELFERGVGEATDVVQKEMFTFEDKAGRSLTLRPENTAGVCRAYVAHGMHKLPQPVKLWYWGPFFRHEAPQAGRYRQFSQLGVEALGSDDPSLDAEVIVLLSELLERAGAAVSRVRLSSLGNPQTRRSYADELREHLRAREADLSEEARSRLEANPLRAFDSDDPGTQGAVAEAPRLLDRLETADREHFEAVKTLLDDAGMGYEVDPTLVRGLDYYTRTVFEFESDRLGAQRQLGGGGRYDGLVEELGGPPTPGVGWAAGVERILLAAEQEDDERAGIVFVAVAKPEAAREAFRVVRELRREGIRAEMEQGGRSVKGQFKHADRVGASAVVIVGDGIEVKDMESGDQRPAADAAEVLALVRR